MPHRRLLPALFWTIADLLDDRACRLGVEGVRDVGDDEPQRLRLAPCEASGDLIRLIAEEGYLLQNPGAQVRPHVGIVVENAGDGGGRNLGMARDIAQGEPAIGIPGLRHTPYLVNATRCAPWALGLPICRPEWIVTSAHFPRIPRSIFTGW
jgi:hypothetical protein